MGGTLLADANVLVDYARSDREILRLASEHLGPLSVVSTVLHGEVRQLDDRACARLAISVIEPTFDQLAEAIARPRSLSFHDWTCLVVARDDRHTLVTNDKVLRRACAREPVPTKWGLDLLLDLDLGGHITRARARRVVGALRELGQGHVTESILERFNRRLGG